MGRLIYSAIASVDGYVNDTEGDFGWAMPDEDVHAFVNDLMVATIRGDRAPRLAVRGVPRSR